MPDNCYDRFDARGIIRSNHTWSGEEYEDPELSHCKKCDRNMQDWLEYVARQRRIANNIKERKNLE